MSTCFRRLNLLKDRPSQSKSPTPSFYQHSKNSRPSSFNQNPFRNRSRSYSNSCHNYSHSKPTFSRSRLHSHHINNRYSQIIDYQSHKHNHYSSRNDYNYRSRYDQHYKNSHSHKKSSSLLLGLLSEIILTLVIVLIVIAREIILTLLDPKKPQIALLLNHDVLDLVLTITPNLNFNPLLIILNVPFQKTLLLSF